MDEAAALHPVEVGYLNEGTDLAIFVACLGLLERGIVQCADGGLRLTVEPGTAVDGHPLEQAAVVALAETTSATSFSVRMRAVPEMRALRRQLLDQELVRDRSGLGVLRPVTGLGPATRRSRPPGPGRRRRWRGWLRWGWRRRARSRPACWRRWTTSGYRVRAMRWPHSTEPATTSPAVAGADAVARAPCSTVAGAAAMVAVEAVGAAAPAAAVTAVVDVEAEAAAAGEEAAVAAAAAGDAAAAERPTGVTAQLGMGLLWRPELAGLVRDEVAAGRLGFVEIIAESVGAVRPAALDGGTTVVPHGVGLGLGGAERPDRGRLARLADVAERCGAPLVSEHIAFVRADGIEAGHLLPLPRTREALDVLVANVREAADQLPVPLALEPIATLVEWPDAELTELAFLTELLDRTDVDLVLDVANIIVNTANRTRTGGPDSDPMALIEGLPLDRVAYVHAAGGRIVHGRHHDTHTDPLWPDVATLVEELWSRHEIPGLLLERDGSFGDADLPSELASLAEAAERGRSRRVLRAPAAVRQPRFEPAPSRQRLATAQSTFVRAVTGHDVTAKGFDTDDLAAVAQVLTHKRVEAVAHAAPDVEALPAFGDQFASWSRENPNAGGGGRTDAVGFLRSIPYEDRTVHACLAAARIQAAHQGLHLWRNDERWVLALRLGPLRLVRAL